MHHLRANWRAIAVVVVFAVAAWLLYGVLKEYRFHEIRQSFRDMPLWKLGLAAALTAVNYLVLTCYDVIAVRTLSHRLAWPKVALASFTGFVTSHNFGALLGGTSVRYRLYSSWGLPTADIVRIVAIVTLTFWIGLCSLGGTAFIVSPFPVPERFHLPFTDMRVAGVVLLAMAAGYVLVTAVRRKPFEWRGVEFRLPPLPLAIAQVVVSSIDMTLAASVMYTLMPRELELSFPQFLPVYLLAVVATVFSHVPGGLGVFELVILSFVPKEATQQVLASLLAFRVVYYLLPLLVAVVLLVVNEVALAGLTGHRAWREVGRWASSVVPLVLAGGTLVCGVVVLLSSATPVMRDRLPLLREWVPLPVLEVAHFVSSITGVTLLLTARGVQRRLDSAWWMAMTLFALGIVCSLLKGLEYEEAVLLAVMLVAMGLSRPRFYRQGSLIHQRYTPTWFAAVAMALGCAVWLGIFAHKHVEYSPDLWWKVAFSADAPRLLRASVGVVAVLLLFSLGRLTSPGRHRPPQATAADLERAAGIVAQSPHTWTNLALLGDKSLLFNDGRSAFVMYGVQGRSWVALGDPVGPDEEQAELVWRFRKQCDRYAGWPAFYQIEQASLHTYLDQGFTLLKLGEEARVPLATFDLAGPARKSLRQTMHRMEREQVEFEVLPACGVEPLLGDLRHISDAWLAEKQGSEKGFSLGFFEPSYLRRFPLAVARKEGRIVAFANLWTSAGKEELSVDLMRYLPDAPSGVMEYLFIELMQWGKAEGFGWFNLGMAPLSGIDDRPLSPLWNRAAGTVFRFGDHFYSFQGLRQYKEKFGPVWKAKYLASPGGLILPRVLADVTLLIGRRRPS